MTPPRDPFAHFRTEAIVLLEEALHSLRLDDAIRDVPVRLGPGPAGKGDLAYPCFPLAKEARKAPGAIAQELADALPHSDTIRWEVDGPYINFTFDDRSLVKLTLDAIATHGDAYGSHEPTGVKAILEHTSANPNGPFHVGRARNPILGDTTARVLRAGGLTLTTEYYVNDMGKQVAILAWGLENLTPADVTVGDRDKIDHQLVPYYQEANRRFEEDPEVRDTINGSLKKFEAGDEEVAHAFREAASRVLSGMRESLATLNIHLDNFKWESEFVQNGAVNQVIEGLKKSPHAKEEDLSWHLDLEPFGVHGKNPRFTFTRSDGTSLYTTRDVAYHMDKFRRADRVIDILGEDHKLAGKQLEIALGELGETRRPEILFYSFVALPEGKMSTRRNRVVFIDDLIDEAEARALEEVRTRRGEELDEAQMKRIAHIVAIGALRFNIVSVQAEKSITFRWEDALAFDGASAPFVQYSHARCAGILAQAGDPGAKADREAMTHPSEVALVKTLARLPDEVARISENLRVHQIAGFALEVANAFNQFYRDCPVLKAEPGLRAARLELVQATKTTLRNTLTLLGIEAPDSM